MPGYSPRSTAAKLGITEPQIILAVNAPDDYLALLQDPPRNLKVVSATRSKVRIAHVFVTARNDLEKQLPKLMKAIEPDGMIWVSWPKKSAKVPTDVTEDVIRDVCLPLGLVDVKVCAVSEVWSGLKLVIRKSNR